MLPVIIQMKYTLILMILMILGCEQQSEIGIDEVNWSIRKAIILIQKGLNFRTYFDHPI
jgi:hypothetical protein